MSITTKSIRLSGSSKAVLAPFMEYFGNNTYFTKSIKTMELSYLTTFKWSSKRVKAKIHDDGNFSVSGKKEDVLAPLLMLFQQYMLKFPSMLIATMNDKIKVTWNNLIIQDKFMKKPTKMFEDREEESTTIEEEDDESTEYPNNKMDCEILTPNINDPIEIKNLDLNKVVSGKEEFIFRCPKCHHSKVFWHDNPFYCCDDVFN